MAKLLASWYGMEPPAWVVKKLVHCSNSSGSIVAARFRSASVPMKRKKRENRMATRMASDRLDVSSYGTLFFWS